MQELQVPDAVIEYVTGGSGPAVLPTHGALIADAMIVPLADHPALASSCQLIGHRRRGYATAEGSQIADGAALADYAADAAALLGHLGVHRAHVARHSSGALVSLHPAHDRPDLTGSLALLEPPLAGPNALRSHQEGVLVSALQRYEAGDREGAVGLFFGAVPGRG